MLSCDSPSQKTTTSGGSSLTCKIPRYRGPVQLKRICQSLQLSAKVPHESNTQMPSMVIIFLEKRLKSADFRSKIPTFYPPKYQLTSGSSGNATYEKTIPKMKTDTLNKERKKNTYKRKLFYVFYVTL